MAGSSAWRWAPARVQATATTDAFQAQVELDAGNSGDINGRLTGERNTGDWRDYPIQRPARGAHRRTAAARHLRGRHRQGQRPAEHAGGHRRHAGRSAVVAGKLQLRDASIDIYQVNLALRELPLDARIRRQDAGSHRAIAAGRRHGQLQRQAAAGATTSPTAPCMWKARICAW